MAASIALRISGLVTTPYASERTSLDARTFSPNASIIAHGGHPFRRAIRSTHNANDSPDAGATTNASRRGQTAAIFRAKPPAVQAATANFDDALPCPLPVAVTDCRLQDR
ncbi:hypothetical protein GCM10009733_021530 [Nonomuraea maheshkhaliensis]|uniref:Uncharacterized protein n=1 Tax=Nonomuraea maheshkhaliensis TaxID=419590 RepID=A0ABN2F010_9ACTN